MSQSLIDKLRRARESSIEAGGRRFTIRRPTDAEATLLAGITGLDLVGRFVVGWDLTGLDLVPGGTVDPVPFDRELWTDWVADRPDLWGPLSDAIVAAYTAHIEARGDGLKN